MAANLATLEKEVQRRRRAALRDALAEGLYVSSRVVLVESAFSCGFHAKLDHDDALPRSQRPRGRRGVSRTRTRATGGVDGSEDDGSGTRIVASLDKGL